MEENKRSIMARKIPVTTNIRCDFDHRVIEKGRFATQVVGDENIRAQGLYHGRLCYEAALADYEQKLKEFNQNQGKTDE